MREYKPTARRQKLTAQQIEYCLLHIIRDQNLFDYAREHLKPTDFNPISETKYALLWASIITVAQNNNNKLPELASAELTVAGELLTKIDTSAGDFTQESANSALDLLCWVYGFAQEQLNPEYHKPLVQDLIIERTVISQMSRDMKLASDVGRPINIVESLNEYTQKLQSALIDHAQAGQSAFPTDYKPKRLDKFSTGEQFLDAFMNGGQSPTEVYVLLGPTGLGKTTIGVMLSVSTARVWNAAYLTNKVPKRKISCFFSWEQDLERLRHRFWAFAAKIDSTRLELYADEAVELSTRGNLEPYELEEFSDVIRAAGQQNIPGESERLVAATRELNECVRIFDFSGTPENPRAGEGGLDEVAAVLGALVKEGHEIGTVVLDYANAAVRRMMSAKNDDPANLRHHLTNFCNDCRFKIGIPYNCPVWVFNQLNTESNRKAPTAKQHHSFASECGNFAENAWFAFVFSTKDPITNTCQLFCTKSRRSSGDKPPVILKIEGNFCRMRDVSELYTVDDRSIIPTNMRQRRVDRSDDKELKNRVERFRPGASGLTGH